MSFMMSAPAPGSAGAGLPQGELVATYSTYAQAREQVDRLAATDFPVTAVSIVGKDLRVVERVRGRLNYAQVALAAGVRGLLFGAMIGAFLLLLDPSGGPIQILVSALLGLAVWLIFGVVGFAMRRGQHGFASSQAVVPTGYDLVVSFEHAARARQELGLGGVGAPVQAPPAASAPAQAAPAGGAAAPATGSGSHAADATAGPSAAPTDSGTATGEDRPATTDTDVPAGLDRSYGVTLPPEEVQRLIEARGGRPAQPGTPSAPGAGHPSSGGGPHRR